LLFRSINITPAKSQGKHQSDFYRKIHGPQRIINIMVYWANIPKKNVRTKK